MVVIVSGVAGSGKTTVGMRLAEELGWRFLDADALHPPANIEKMRAGLPLDESDRAPWLDTLRGEIDAAIDRDEPLVVACSALRRAHRERLGGTGERVRLVFLDVPSDELARRLSARRHFFPARLLESQLRELERPDGGLHLRATGALDEIVGEIRRWLRV